MAVLQDAEMAAMPVTVATAATSRSLASDPHLDSTMPHTPTELPTYTTGGVADPAALQNANSTVAPSTPVAQYTEASSVTTRTGLGGHALPHAFRAAHTFTRPAHVSLRARLRASSSQHGEPSRIMRRNLAHDQPLADSTVVTQERPAQAQAPGMEHTDAFAYRRLARQIRFGDGAEGQTPAAVQQQAQGTGVQLQVDAVGATSQVPPARLRPESEKLKRMLVDALLILGYLHLDGEGTKRDNQEAVVAMRRAAELGSDEARRTLGWLYNTGQFGD